MELWILVVLPVYVCTVLTLVSSEVRWNSREASQGRLFAAIRLESIFKVSYLPLAISLPFYETTAIRARPNYPQWKKTYYHDFCYTSLLTTAFFLVWFWGVLLVCFFLFFVWGGVLFWGFLVLLWRFFACVFYSLGEGAFVLPRFLFLNNEVLIQCTVKSTPRVTICPTTLHPNELPSPQVTCTTGCLLHLTSGTRCPKQKPLKIKTSFSADMAKV